MRTTLDIDEHPLRSAKPLAARERKTLTRIIEQALRDRVARPRRAAAPFTLTLLTKKGRLIPGVTHPRLFDPPRTADEACTALERVLASPSLRVLDPGERYWPRLAAAVRQADAAGNLTFDAQLAALCREHGVGTLLTEDRDFDRSAGLRSERL